MVKPRLRRPSPVLVTIPDYRERCPRPLSAFEDSYSCVFDPPCHFNGGLLSQASPPPSAMAARPPTLTEILLDVSPPPWTLSAFMGYLSQNHCMETLEFTLDSQRYAACYDQLSGENPHSQESNAKVCGWWNKLIQIYIVPCAPREVNIPARVRDRLLSLPSGPSPPHPSELEEAGQIIFELMNDSLLLPFLQSVAPVQPTGQVEEQFAPKRRSDPSQPCRPTLATSVADLEGLTDDSDSNSPSAAEPMTPPTTPPTSEYTFNASSPGGFQRAMAAHNKGWKRVGAKLGFNRKASGRRAAPTSATSEGDSAIGEASHSRESTQ